MISRLFEFLIKSILWVVKCIFELLAFFIRQLGRLLRLFMAVFPITGAAFFVLFLFNLVCLFTDKIQLPPQLPVFIDQVSVRKSVLSVLSSYLKYMSAYNGTLMYFVLFFFLFILIVPMACILLAASTLQFCGKLLGIIIIADMALYLIGAFLGKAPHQMIISRYKKLFPSAGHKLDERSYNNWLRRHNREFEDDSFGKPEAYGSDDEFYDDEDSYYENEDYYRGRSSHNRYIREYDEDYYEDDEDYDEDEDDLIEENEEYDDEYDDFYDEPKTPFSGKAATFNFFAGCSSLESADKKYKSLVKLYHPDNLDGDTAVLQEINAQYSEIKKRLS